MAHRAGRDAGSLGHLRKRGPLVAVAAKDQHRAVDDLGATLVGATMPPGLALDSLQFLYCHTRSFP
jgi:hypothetical protein